MSVIDSLRALAPVQNYRPMSHPDQLWRGSLLSRCPRIQILAAKGINLRLPDSLARKFSMHGGAHDACQQWIVDAFSGPDYDVVTEMPIYDPETRCGGNVDAVVVDGDVAHVIEIKTYAFLKGDPKEDSYWQHQISFYYQTIADMQRWVIVVPVIMVVTLEGQVRVVEPKVTDEYRNIIGLLNLAWESDTLPEYCDCYQYGCAKCPLQPTCTEPLETITEFAEAVTKRSE